MPRSDRALALLVVPLLGAPAIAGSLHSAWSDQGARPVFRFADLRIQESSGLVVDGDTVVTVNDSGDRGRVFVVDGRSGRTVGVTSWSDPPEDVEALAPAGPGAVWVADIGDNRAARESVSVFWVPVGRGTRSVEPAYLALRYPGGPVDAETLLASPRTGRLFVVSKELAGGHVYAVPRAAGAGPGLLTDVGRVAPLVTDGAFLPDGRHIVLRTYTAALVYSFPGLELLARVELPAQQQGEALAVTGGAGRWWLWVSSEGSRQPVYRVPLRRLGPAADLVAPSPADDSPSASARVDSGRAKGLGAGESSAARAGRWWPGAIGGLAAAGLVAGVIIARRRRSTDPA